MHAYWAKPNAWRCKFFLNTNSHSQEQTDGLAYPICRVAALQITTLDLIQVQIKTWFQNRRTKWKKQINAR